MSAFKQPSHHYSIEQYFDLLTSSQRKYEYHDGKVTMMAGGKRAHNKAKRNLFSAIEAGRGDCHLYDSDTAIFIEAANRYYFPDIAGLCGEEQWSDEGGIERIFNPTLIIEVLSSSSTIYDTGEEFAMYRKLPSLKEYITVDSRAVLVSTYYRRDNGDWQIGSYYNLDQEVEIQTFGLHVPLSLIYDGVDFDEEER